MEFNRFWKRQCSVQEILAINVKESLLGRLTLKALQLVMWFSLSAYMGKAMDIEMLDKYTNIFSALSKASYFSLKFACIMSMPRHNYHHN